MTAPTIRQLLADVLDNYLDWRESYPLDGYGSERDAVKDLFNLADALLASPELAAILDHAAHCSEDEGGSADLAYLGPEVRALLADWRANRAEQEPER
jgi:hypothetical protein